MRRTGGEGDDKRHGEQRQGLMRGKINDTFRTILRQICREVPEQKLGGKNVDTVIYLLPSTFEIRMIKSKGKCN